MRRLLQLMLLLRATGAAWRLGRLRRWRGPGALRALASGPPDRDFPPAPDAERGFGIAEDDFYPPPPGLDAMPPPERPPEDLDLAQLYAELPPPDLDMSLDLPPPPVQAPSVAVDPEVILEGLNDAQAEAVAAPVDAVSVVTAGPGSGKTRVLTRRVAWLLAGGAAPSQILCVTFTNKAAREMRERLEELLVAGGHGRGTRGLTVGTFHGVCARLLRSYAAEVATLTGLPLGSDFSIYSVAECNRLLREVAAKHNVAVGERAELAKMLNRVQKEKALDMEALIKSRTDPSPAAEEAAKKRKPSPERALAPLYVEALRQANAVDFDDLLLLAWFLLSCDSRARDELRDRFRHVLVDEWQDTNVAQYELIQQLFPRAGAASGAAHSLFVVGDVDQSIYGWRGAEKKNTDRLFEDFKSITKRYALRENYRSTAEIATVASAVLDNRRATESKLGLGGRPVRFLRVPSDAAQADLVAREIRALSQGRDPTRTGEVLRRMGASAAVLAQRPEAGATVPPGDLGDVCALPAVGMEVGVKDEHDASVWHRAEIMAVTRKGGVNGRGGGRGVDCTLRYSDNGDVEELKLPDPDVRMAVNGAAAPAAALGTAEDTSAWRAAVFYRTNAQSRALEAALSQHQVPYVLQGSRGFFARKEVLDTLAYLRLLSNPSNEAAFMRAVNYPPRGAGAATIQAFLNWKSPGKSLLDKLELLLQIYEGPTGATAAAGTTAKKPKKGKKKAGDGANEGLDCPLTARQQKALAGFALIQRDLRAKVATASPTELVRAVCDGAELMQQLKKDAKSVTEAEDRQQNLFELMSFAAQLARGDVGDLQLTLDEEPEEDDGPEAASATGPDEETFRGPDALRVFLQKVDLASDPVDAGGEAEEEIEPVRLMTLHASKGLEFDAVWLTGAEEGSLPMAMDTTDVEEERRLFYVGLTRAKTSLTVLARRDVQQLRPGADGGFKGPRRTSASRFLEQLRRKKQLGPEMTQWIDLTGDNWRDSEERFDKAGKKGPGSYAKSAGYERDNAGNKKDNRPWYYKKGYKKKSTS